MEGRSLEEDREQQVAGDLGIEPNTALDERAQADIALQNDQRACVFPRQRTQGEKDLVSRFRAPVAAKDAFSSQTCERPAYLRLKKDDNCDSRIGREGSEKCAKRFEPGSKRDLVSRENGENPGENR